MSEKINEIINNSKLSPEEKLDLISKKLDSVADETANNSEDNDFSQLQDLLKSDKWPEAVLEFQIADDTSEEDKTDRAEGIIDILIEESLEGKRFLDFGCGEGHSVKYSSEENASVSVGYDIKSTGKLPWEQDGKFLLTTEFEKVLDKGPFDIVLIYDVLDHAEDPMDVLLKASSVLSPTGTIYLRCHPFSSRHGGHCYRKLNKAFVHLVFSEEELSSLGCELEFNNKTLFPLGKYASYFERVRLRVEKTDIEEQQVESFFRENYLVRERILKLFDKKEWQDGCPVFQMSQCFVDYVLKNV